MSMQILLNRFAFFVNSIARNSRKIRVAIADDFPVVRQGLAQAIRTAPDLELVGEAINGQEAVELYRQQQPDLILIETCLPIINGIEAIAAIRQEFPRAKIIALSTCDFDEEIYGALQAGASGYLLKDSSLETLLDAIRQVYALGQYFPPQIAARLATIMNSPRLTAREQQVLELIAQGRSNPEIGNLLAIGENTVKFHVNNILIKLGVGDNFVKLR